MLILSLLALFVGPALYLLLRRFERLKRVLDAFVIGLLAVTVLIFLLPHLWQEMGVYSVLLVSIGYLLPGILEKLVRRAAHTMHLFSIVAALLGLLLHALLDGAGLVQNESFGAGLGAAIVLHRVGAGLMVWMIVAPAFGQRAGWGVLMGMAVATLIGFAWAEPLVSGAHQGIWPVVAGIITGMILHSLVHRGHMHDHAEHS